MRKPVAIVAVAVAVAAGVGYWQFGDRLQTVGGASPAKAPPAAAPAAGAPPAMVTAVEAQKVAVLAMPRQIPVVGSLRANESVVIRPEIAGRVTRILFTEGQKVTKGQPLIKLDDSIYAAQLEKARANLEFSRSNARRAATLFSQGAGTERARDESEAKLKVDQADVELARVSLDKTQINAPFDGIVGLRGVSVGAYVTPGMDIVDLQNIDPIKVDFRVPEVFLSTLKAGQPLTLTADAFPGRPFTGQVLAISPLVDESGRNILVRALVPNADAVLRPGLFVRVVLVAEQNAEALVVPEEALMPRGSEMTVYRVAEGKVSSVIVKTGQRRDGKVEIVEGLAADDMVVTAGQMKLRPGAPVTVVTPKQGS